MYLEGKSLILRGTQILRDFSLGFRHFSVPYNVDKQKLEKNNFCSQYSTTATEKNIIPIFIFCQKIIFLRILRENTK